MILPYFQILVTLIIRITSITSNWVSDRGLWYYISEDTRNYTDAAEYCESLNGHLITIVDKYQIDFLKRRMGNVRRWIGLSTIHTFHICGSEHFVWAGDYDCSIVFPSDIELEEDPKNHCVAYALNDNIKSAKCKTKLGFICQWQCNTLSVISHDVPLITAVYKQKHYRSNRKFYESIPMHGGLVKSLYAQIVCNDNTGCPNKWTFFNNDKNIIYHNDIDITPYNRTQWNQTEDDFIIYRNVYFTCMDCLEYDIKLSNGSVTTIATVKRTDDYHYMNKNDPNKPELLFDRDSVLWCYVQNLQKLGCFRDGITPIGYVSTVIQSYTIHLNISCVTMDRHYNNDIDQFTTKSQTTTLVATMAKLPSSEPESTEKQGIVTTNEPESIRTPVNSIGMLTTSDIHATQSPSPTTNRFVSTQDNHPKTKLSTMSDMYPSSTTSTFASKGHLTNTTPTTLDLYSQTVDPQYDALQNEQGNMNTSDRNMYIGIAVGAVLLIVIAVIIGVVLYKRRNTSKGNTETVTQNLNDVHVITDKNIYSVPSLIEPPTSRVPHVQMRNGLSNLTNTTETAPNIPSRNHAQSKKYAVTGAQGDKAFPHASSTDAHGSSNMPIYSEVNKHRKPVPHVPTEPVYSQVSKKTKTLNGEHKQDNKHSNGAYSSDSDIEFCDNDVYESKGMPCTKTHTNTGDNSDEEFSDNELYERGTAAPAHRQTDVSTNVVDNKVFDNASEDDNIEMVDNDMYGQM